MLATIESGGVHVPRSKEIGFLLPDFDARVYGYDGSGRIETITFKLGGLSGSTVATLTRVYGTSGSSNGKVVSEVLALS